MTTLADFLLARIAEREALVDRFGDHDHWLTIHDTPVWSSGHERAECEAKRRIVGLVSLWGAPPQARSEVLSLLALPYADHPDYREEWKVA